MTQSSTTRTSIRFNRSTASAVAADCHRPGPGLDPGRLIRLLDTVGAAADWVWKGTGPPGSSRGNWVNPNWESGYTVTFRAAAMAPTSTIRTRKKTGGAYFLTR